MLEWAGGKKWATEGMTENRRAGNQQYTALLLSITSTRGMFSTSQLRKLDRIITSLA